MGEEKEQDAPTDQMQGLRSLRNLGSENKESGCMMGIKNV